MGQGRMRQPGEVRTPLCPQQCDGGECSREERVRARQEEPHTLAIGTHRAWGAQRLLTSLPRCGTPRWPGSRW